MGCSHHEQPARKLVNLCLLLNTNYVGLSNSEIQVTRTRYRVCKIEYVEFSGDLLLRLLPSELPRDHIASYKYEQRYT